MESVLRKFLIVSQYLGYTGIQYNSLTDKFSGPKGCTLRRTIRILMKFVLYLSPLAFMGLQYAHCMVLRRLMESTPDIEVPACNSANLHQRITDFFVLFVICMKLNFDEHKIVDYLNILLDLVKFIKTVLKGKLNCPLIAHPVLLMVFIRLLARTSMEIFVFWKFSHEESLIGKYLFVATLVTYFCRLFIDFQITAFFLHFLVHSAVYDYFNNFITKKLSAKREITFHRMLNKESRLRTSQRTANSYFEFLFIYTMFRAFVCFRRFLTAFTYDDRSLVSRDMELGFRELDDMDEGMDDLYIFVPEYTRLTGILVEGTFLGFFLIDLLSINFGAWLLHRQKKCFKQNLLNLHNDAESWSKELSTSEQEANQGTFEMSANEIRQIYPKYTFWDSVLKTSMTPNRFTNDKIYISRVFCYKVCYKDYNRVMILLVSTVLLALFTDYVQLTLIDQLTAYLKTQM